MTRINQLFGPTLEISGAVATGIPHSNLPCLGLSREWRDLNTSIPREIISLPSSLIISLQTMFIFSLALVGFAR